MNDTNNVVMLLKQRLNWAGFFSAIAYCHFYWLRLAGCYYLKKLISFFFQNSFFWLNPVRNESYSIQKQASKWWVIPLRSRFMIISITFCNVVSEVLLSCCFGVRIMSWEGVFVVTQVQSNFTSMAREQNYFAFVVVTVVLVLLCYCYCH